MVYIKGYSIKENIYSGEKTNVYRAVKDQKPVIIKILQNDFPSISELDTFTQESQIVQILKGKWIVKFICIEKFKNRFAIVFDDIGATALSNLIKEKGKYSLSEGIDIALKIVYAMEEIHNSKIIHRDIKPHNIVLNETTGELNIIDFGTASLVHLQNSFIPITSSLEGTLAYISPEQTGRMNRSVDYRTDFYSLGVTLYQIFTGELPFIFSDPMELIHAHIAKQPLSPFEKNTTPRILSEIIMKLLEKNPDDRYQSIFGLLYDLEWCRDNLLNSSYLEDIDFLVGKKDIVGKFKVPDKLYGRTKELSRIVKAYKRISDGNRELIIISGRSGVGKSVLAHEIKNLLKEQKGYFSFGKYEQSTKFIPFKAITQSLDGLIEQILMGSATTISIWKERILEAVGDRGRILTDLLPRLEILIGSQPAIINLSLTESQNRLQLVFQDFIRCLCTKELPVVIFLDDLQWVDSASLTLIQNVMEDAELKYFLFVLTFRNNEAKLGNELEFMFRDWFKKLIGYKPILLEPISKFDVTHLVMETLGKKEEDCKELVDLLFEKTHGNPFFTIEVFNDLYNKGFIYFSSGGWIWDIEKIRSVIRISENVVSLMIEKINQLSEESIGILKLAACIGDWFRISIFAGILNKSQSNFLNSLNLIINEGLFIKRENSVGFVQDEVREATYKMMTPNERSLNHYLIGSFYLTNSREEDLDSQVYTIVEHLNLGIMHVKHKNEKKRLLDLNLLLGNKYVAITDYSKALELFNIALTLLPDNPWHSDYKNTLALYSAKAFAECLNANFTEADRLYEFIYKNCKSLLDKIPIVHNQLRQKNIEGKGDEAFKIGFQTLKELGLEIPNQFDLNQVNSAFLKEIGKYEDLLGERQILDLLHFSKMKNPIILEAISLITNLSDIAIVFRPDLVAFIATLGVNLSLEYGNAVDSSISYMLFGVITNLFFKDYKTGYELGQLSLKLNQEIFPNDLIFEKTYAFYGWNISHWVKSAKEDLEIGKKGYNLCLANGDLAYANYFLLISSMGSFFIGHNLDEVLEYTKKAIDFSAKYKIQMGSAVALPNLFFIMALQEKTENLFSFNSELFGEEEYFFTYSSIKQGICYFYLRKFQLFYILNEYDKCFEILSELEKKIPYIQQHLGYCEFHFFNALVLIQLASTHSEENKLLYKEKLLESYEYLKLWSSLCVENFFHKFMLVEAEKARVENRILDAIDFYDKSIEFSLANEYTNDLAIASELAGNFFISIGKPKLAVHYLLDAHYYFSRWGAFTKVKQLEGKYPEIKKKYSSYFPKDITASTNSLTSITTMGAKSGNIFLDLDTVFKASQILASEIHLGKLLEKMMKILFENAGAVRGVFLLNEDNKWYVEAEGDESLNTISVLEAKPFDGYSELSSGIVNYVIHTKSLVILNDALNNGIFVNDPYVISKKSKSILCSPIINQGNLIGIIYLENNLTTDVFTNDRLQILKVLSSQIAVSIENAVLYSSLEAKVDERTKELSSALTHVNTLLNEVSSLKEKQDADYFLTTLLVEPLGKNKATSENFTIKFFNKQKKNFYFRNKLYELGGDINISETIQLKGRKYIVFLNGDAMGKSIQGAGGVLVLGTVFKFIIQRTLSKSADRNYYPERWLKNAFVEIHKVFEGFEGSMLVSLVFGLLDEITGTVFFINADHPEIVILRENKAKYISKYNRYKKIGVRGQVGNISISLFQILPGDNIIIGSDGRDDFILEKNNAVIEESQKKDLFLEIVEECQGNLEQIYEKIHSYGVIGDDISMILVEFKEKYRQKRLRFTNLEVSLDLLAIFKKGKDFQKYFELAEILFIEYPFEYEIFITIVNELRQNQEYEKAAELGEVILLRYPESEVTLVSLIELYLELGKKESAWHLFDRLADITTNIEILNKLDEKLRG
ncbi:MAG: AAA family ATPase [Leptospiraceae bacterium]|nr:AAA family ATPase [Leptospiraceae bacterium]